ncbi:MAG: RluA family pseudouridine synthase [Candidatus Komeilibacteria bacterium]|nr:RluA family pseudouridine synthase [Candidatus Komeilibacteria bacterium]
MKLQKFVYDSNNNDRLDKFLTEKLSYFSRSAIQKNIKAGGVIINDKKITSPHHFLDAGDVISWQVIPRKKAEPRKIEVSELLGLVRVIKQTEDYVVIEKPAGLLVHPTETSYEQTLVDWLENNFPAALKLGEDPSRPGLVHRLDKDVSGIMIIPLNLDYYDYLKKEFKLRHIDKTYVALVYGALENLEGRIDLPISRSSTSGKMAAHSREQGGRTAITEYIVKQQFINYTLVEVKLITGRTNQIRVHFNAIGHSLVGDTLYLNKGITKPVNLDRIFLHAEKMRIVMPDGKPAEFIAPLPLDLQEFLTTIK